MEHTKEPWERKGALVFLGRYGGFDMRGCPKSEANARRIVACVNACEGIPIEQLEFDRPTFVRMLLQRQDLQLQRDELLALVKRYRNETPLGHQPHMLATEADAAITKAEE